MIHSVDPRGHEEGRDSNFAFSSSRLNLYSTYIIIYSTFSRFLKNSGHYFGECGYHEWITVEDLVNPPGLPRAIDRRTTIYENNLIILNLNLFSPCLFVCVS